MTLPTRSDRRFRLNETQRVVLGSLGLIAVLMTLFAGMGFLAEWLQNHVGVWAAIAWCAVFVVGCLLALGWWVER